MRIATSRAIMAITTSNSIKVNPGRFAMSSLLPVVRSQDHLLFEIPGKGLYCRRSVPFGLEDALSLRNRIIIRIWVKYKAWARKSLGSPSAPCPAPTPLNPTFNYYVMIPTALAAARRSAGKATSGAAAESVFSAGRTHPEPRASGPKALKGGRLP
jgi:hypothetical protein